MTDPTLETENPRDKQDQTYFGFEEPLFETGQSPAPVPVVSDQDVAPASFYRRHPWLVAGGGVLVSLVIVLGLAVMLTPSPTPSTPQASVAPTVQKKTDNPFQQRLDEITEELKTADPAKPQQSFPLVNMDIRIDKKQWPD